MLIEIISKFGDEYIPKYATYGSAGMDLIAPFDFFIQPGDIQPIDTGLKFNIQQAIKYHNILYEESDPEGAYETAECLKFAALIVPKSGRGVKEGLVIANTLGLLDQDYQGTLTVFVYNRSERGIFIGQGEKFVQMVIMPVINVQWKPVEVFKVVTGRGEGGFGSTGL